MAVLLLLLLVAAASPHAGDAQGCERRYLVQLYKELGCKALFSHRAKCPTHYDCSTWTLMLGPNQCLYDDTIYVHGATLVTSDTIGRTCVCQRGMKVGYLKCEPETVECPEHFTSPDTGCIPLYDNEHYCSVSSYCRGDPPPRATCTYNGQRFIEGQKFYPSNTCQECVCKRGFNGVLTAPYCKPVMCDSLIHYGQDLAAGCVPIYYEGAPCCQVPELRCPTRQDRVISRRGKRITNMRCYFGNRILYLGDELDSWDTPNMICTCEVPPMISCVKGGNRTASQERFPFKKDPRQQTSNNISPPRQRPPNKYSPYMMRPNKYDRLELQENLNCPKYIERAMRNKHKLKILQQRATTRYKNMLRLLSQQMSSADE